MKGLEEYDANPRFFEVLFKFPHIFMIFRYEEDFVTLHCFPALSFIFEPLRPNHIIPSASKDFFGHRF